MKEFNLEAAKAGAPVCTRDGRKARIICFDRDDPDYCIVALIENTEGGVSEDIETFNKSGEVFCNDNNGIDLVMATVKREGWMNIYPASIFIKDNAIADCGLLYDSPETAKAHQRDNDNCIATVKVEWEE